MKYYKTGEFARMANVSIRTIRYYDNQGLLKPTYINDKGYRFYTDKDFVKLQQILSLKYLGFSLDEIFSMTIQDDYHSLKESLKLQMKLIQQRIDHLKLVQSSLKETGELLEQNDNIDWNHILKLIHLSTMKNDLVEQYKNATNVDIRIRLHDKYSQNPVTWFKWLYSFYDLKESDTVLELGCGNGKLWQENKLDIKGNIVVSDISSGMVDDARDNLKDINQISFKCFDCHHIPFDDCSFDVVIANHLLFYVKDIESVLKEIERVLKPNGKLFASTYGTNHMKEITTLVKEYDSRITLSEVNLYEIFGLENGYQILSKVFNRVDKKIYDDYLLVDSIDDLTNYILSCHGNQTEYISKDFNAFKRYITRKVVKDKKFKITKDAGLFICSKDA